MIRAKCIVVAGPQLERSIGISRIGVGDWDPNWLIIITASSMLTIITAAFSEG